MDKCWFPLWQSHFAPPPDVESMRVGAPTAALSLGHIVPDLRRLDQVVNRDSFEPFPLGMPIHRAELIDVTCGDAMATEAQVGAHAGVPLLAAATALPVPGVQGVASAGAKLARTAQRQWRFSRLESYVVNPTRAYVQRCLAASPVADHIRRTKRLGTWSVFMVTGLMVARGGGRSVVADATERSVFGGLGV